MTTSPEKTPNKGENMDTEKPVDFQQQLEEELAGVQERIVQYIEQFRNVDKVLVVVGCDDTRVGVSTNPVDIEGKSTMMVYVPKIGGGIPDIEEIKSILTYLKRWGVPQSQIEIISTQHGSTAEIEGNSDRKTCGLRAAYQVVAEQYPQLLSELQPAMTAGSADSQTSLSQLPDSVKGVLEKLSQETHFPARLLKIALLNNLAADINENQRLVTAEMKKLLEQAGIALPVSGGNYDHNQKKIITSDQQIETQVTPWSPEHQDPSVIVISYGPLSAVVHDEVIFPQIVGNDGVANNDFSTCAIGDQESLLDAIAEAWYAAHNHHDAAEGHSHGGNFDHTEACLIVCDNQQFIDQARQAIESEEFQRYYKTDFDTLRNGTVLINLETGERTTL